MFTTTANALDMCDSDRTRKKHVQRKMNSHSNCQCSESN